MSRTKKRDELIFKVNKLGGFMLVRCKPQINKWFYIQPH